MENQAYVEFKFSDHVFAGTVRSISSLQSFIDGCDRRGEVFIVSAITGSNAEFNKTLAPYVKTKMDLAAYHAIMETM